MATTLARIEFRRKTAAQWTSSNEVLLASEPGVETDTGKWKFGDGTTTWSALPYQAPTAASLSATSATLWKANTAYTAGQAVVNPAGFVVTALTGFTSGSSYSASNWSDPVAATYGTAENVLTIIPGGTTNTARKVYATFAAAAAAVTNGTVVRFAPGTHTLASQIALTSLTDITLDLSGATLVPSFTTGSVINLTACTRIRIIGGRILGDGGVRNSSNHGVAVGTSTDVEVRGTRVEAVRCFGMIVGGSNRVTVSGCSVIGSMADGIQTTNGATNVSVVGNTIQNSGDDSISVVSYQTDSATCVGVAISGNVINSSNARGIAVIGGENIAVTGNVVVATKSAGIRAAQETGSFNGRRVYGVSITGNVIRSANTLNGTPNAGGIHVDAYDAAFGATDITIANNTILDSLAWGIQLKAFATGALTQVVVTGNVIKNTGLDGILALAVGTLNVSGNTVRYVATSGVNIDSTSTNVQVVSNTVYFPNQVSGSTSYGVVNNATGTASWTGLNVVQSDGGKTALVSTVVFATNTYASQVSGPFKFSNQVNVSTGGRALVVDADSAGIVLRGGYVNWVPTGASAGGGTMDTGITRDSAGVVKITNGSTGGGALKTGSANTAGRPSASTAGQSAQWFDTTLNKPIWSDGTNWRDASGATV